MTILQDLRYGLRMLAKNPGSTAVAVLTLALGMGANTAIFSLINAVLLRPLPGTQHPEQLIVLERIQKGYTGDDFGYPDYLDYRDRNRSFAGLAADNSSPLSFSGQVTERIQGSLVSGNYFSVLGIRPAVGRLIEPQDVQVPGETPVAVLSHGFWQRAFGGDPAVVGRTVRLNNYSFTVVGVAPANFRGTRIGRAPDVWVPLTMQPQAIPQMSEGVLQNRASGWIEIFGRRKPGVGPEQAQADLNTIALQLAQEYPLTNATRHVGVMRLLGIDPDARAALQNFLGLVMGAVGVLLMIACSNVAGLQLARAAERRREIAIRLALGSSKIRLFRQLLVEGLLLSTLAAGMGLILTPWIGQMAAAFRQPVFELRQLQLSLDARVLVFTLLVSIASAVLLVLAPAMRASRKDIAPDLKDGAPAFARGRSRMQSSLVVAQVALSLVLLVGAGLAVRTLQKVLAVDRGFEERNILLVSLDLSIQGYSETAGRAFYDQLLGRVRALPGVQSVSLAGTVPPTEWPGAVSVFYEGQAPPPEILRGREFELGLRANIDLVAPRYFRTLGIPLLAGRDFDAQDRPDARRVAIASEALAERLWPGQNAVGKRLEVPLLDHVPQPPVEIVGVAGDTRHRSLLTSLPLLLYLPRAQNYDGRGVVIVRTAVDPLALLTALRGEVAALDKNLPIAHSETLSDHIAQSLWQQRMAAWLIGLFGVLALTLAAIGLYGVISRSVAQRTREIGVRIALGANRAEILKLVVGQGMKLTLVGVALGLTAAVLSTHKMTGFLYGVNAYDPASLAFACLVLAGVALLASYMPARQATNVDPQVALRYE